VRGEEHRTGRKWDQHMDRKQARGKQLTGKKHEDLKSRPRDGERRQVSVRHRSIMGEKERKSGTDLETERWWTL
jgi:hypothetical protein